MTAVHKHSVPVDDQWHEIPADPVLHVACQGGVDTVQVWTLATGDPRTRRVRVFGTGRPLPYPTRHLGSVVTAGGALVWHLFDDAADTLGQFS